MARTSAKYARAAPRATTPYEAAAGPVRTRSNPGGGEGNNGQPKQQVQVRPHHHGIDPPGRSQQVMVVVPVDADDSEAEDVDQQRWQATGEPVKGGPTGVFRSKAMIVMITAITPSLNASSRWVSMACRNSARLAPRRSGTSLTGAVPPTTSPSDHAQCPYGHDRVPADAGTGLGVRPFERSMAYGDSSAASVPSCTV